MTVSSVPPISVTAARLGRLLLIEEGEYRSVAYFLSFFLVIGAGMALGRGTADALFLKRYGVEYLPGMYVLLSFLLSGVSLIYAAFADRLPAERFFGLLLGVLGVLLLGNWALMTFTSNDLAYPAYFLLYEVASELLLVHGALYLGQNLDTLQSKRLYPLILAGAQVGTVCGGLVLAGLGAFLGVQNILLVWTGLLVAAMGLLVAWHRRRGGSAYFRPPHRARNQVAQSIDQIRQALRFTRESDLLRKASWATFFMVIAFYILSYSANRVYTETFRTEEALVSFFGVLAAATNLTALLLQVFVTSRLVDRFGVRRVNLVFPITTVASFAVLNLSFGLVAAVLASVNKDAIMQAFRNPVRLMFFNVLPQSVQGRARAMSVVLVMPLALLVCGATLWLTQILQHPLYFLIPGAVAALFYLHFNLGMNRAYTSTLIKHLRQRLFLPGREVYGGLRGSGDEVFQMLARGVDHDNPQFALTFARALAASYPERAAQVIFPRLRRCSPADADPLVKVLVPLRVTGLEGYLRKQLQQGDPHLRATALKALFALRDERARSLVQEALHSDNPRLRAAGVFGALTYPLGDLAEPALRSWAGLLLESTESRLAALELLGERDKIAPQAAEGLSESYRVAFLSLLSDTSDSVKARTLRAFVAWDGPPMPQALPFIERLLRHTNPELRRGAALCLRLVPESRRDPLVLLALEDADPQVRTAALGALHDDQQGLRAILMRWLAVENRGSPRAQQTLLSALLKQGLPNEASARVFHHKTEDAVSLYRAMVSLGRSTAAGAGFTLVGLTLAERVPQVLDLALQALQSLEDPIAVATIRAGVKSRNPRHVANACEALRNMESRPETRTLSRLVEALHRRGRFGSDRELFPSAQAVLDWCLDRDDRWLRTCADHAVRALMTPKEASSPMTDLFERMLLLKKSPIFSEVNTEDLQVVAQALEEEIYFSGDRVFAVGEAGDRMYIVVAGKVGISIAGDPALKEFVAVLGPGEWFGEMSLLDELPRSATAHVLEDTRLLSLEKERLRGLVMSYPELSLGVLRGLSLRLREANRMAVTPGP